MSSIKSQNTLGNQRGKERPVGFSHGHLAYSSVHWSPRIPSTRLIQHYLGVFKKQKQNSLKDWTIQKPFNCRVYGNIVYVDIP